MKTIHLSLVALVGVGFATPLAAQVFTDSTGKVGIGNNTPDAKLVVQAAGTEPAGTMKLYAPSKGGLPSHVHWGGTGDWYIRSASSAGKIVLQDFGGNVGVGTGTPQHRLTVGPSSDAAPVTFRSFGENGGAWKGGGAFGGANATVILGEVNGKAEIGAHNGNLTAWSNLILNRGGGNVGIGTVNPIAKLNVTDWQVDVRIAEGTSPDGWAKDGMTVIGNPGINYSTFRVFSGHNPVADRVLASFERQSESYLMVRMDGAVGIGTRTPGARLDVAGDIRCTTLQLTSDRSVKGGFESVNARTVLSKVAALPITTWHYNEAPGTRHIGPMAQDFRAAFELGDDRHISVVDGLGVALAAIQGLRIELNEAKDQIHDRDGEIAALTRQLADLRDQTSARLAAIERAIKSSRLPVAYQSGDVPAVLARYSK